MSQEFARSVEVSPTVTGEDLKGWPTSQFVLCYILITTKKVVTNIYQQDIF